MLANDDVFGHLANFWVNIFAIYSMIKWILIYFYQHTNFFRISPLNIINNQFQFSFIIISKASMVHYRCEQLCHKACLSSSPEEWQCNFSIQFWHHNYDDSQAKFIQKVTETRYETLTNPIFIIFHELYLDRFVHHLWCDTTEGMSENFYTIQRMHGALVSFGFYLHCILKRQNLYPMDGIQ